MPTNPLQDVLVRPMLNWLVHDATSGLQGGTYIGLPNRWLQLANGFLLNLISAWQPAKIQPGLPSKYSLGMILELEPVFGRQKCMCVCARQSRGPPKRRCPFWFPFLNQGE